jgi:hypothetical protein
VSLLAAFKWVQATALAVAINNSSYAFAISECFHLIALAVIGGAVLIVDARLLGYGFRRQRVADVAAAARPWLIGSLVLIVLTGYLMFSSLAADKYYWNVGFRWKMALLAAAIAFTFLVRQPYALRSGTTGGTAVARVVAAVSIGLWLGVAVMGRAIGFL